MEIVRYKAVMADLLTLEKKLVQWYGRRSDALWKEVGERLVESLGSAAGGHRALGDR